MGDVDLTLSISTLSLNCLNTIMKKQKLLKQLKSKMQLHVAYKTRIISKDTNRLNTKCWKTYTMITTDQRKPGWDTQWPSEQGPHQGQGHRHNKQRRQTDTRAPQAWVGNTWATAGDRTGRTSYGQNTNPQRSFPHSGWDERGVHGDREPLSHGACQSTAPDIHSTWCSTGEHMYFRQHRAHSIAGHKNEPQWILKIEVLKRSSLTTE